MAMGYIEVCQCLPWCQSFDLGPYAWTWSGWRRYGSPSDETEITSLGSGMTEPIPKASGKTEHVALGKTETTSLGLGEMEPAPKGLGEAEPMALGSGETF